MKELFEKLTQLLNEKRTNSEDSITLEVFKDSSSIISIIERPDHGKQSEHPVYCFANLSEVLTLFYGDETIDYEKKYLEACRVIAQALGIEYNPENYKTHNSHEYFFDEIARLYDFFLIENGRYDSDDISPCPFCCNKYPDVVEEQNTSEHGAILYEYIMRCDSCSAQFGPFNSAKQLIEEWNRRDGE